MLDILLWALAWWAVMASAGWLTLRQLRAGRGGNPYAAMAAGMLDVQLTAIFI